MAAVASIIGLLVGGLLYIVLGPRMFVISATLTLFVFMLGFAIPQRRVTEGRRTHDEQTGSPD
jgi:hypothetical protein